jgi:glycosyltransferase involved in cell wall biosynthesis
MRLVFVGHRCCDHSESSGYDQIASIFPDAGWLDGRSLGAGELEWIRRPSSEEPSPLDLFHVFYGDCSGSALPAILRDRFPEAIVVATAHQPISRLQHDPEGWAGLEAVDAVITVCHEQARHLAGLGLRCPVYGLPHGVWTRAFRLAEPDSPTARDSVLMVGTYLRDWDSSRRIIDQLAASGIRTDLVGSGDRLAVDHPLVTRHSRVSETELARLYQRSAALVLPVLDATASNALLEAMAAGCPVVCPRFASLIDEYLGDDADAYASDDPAGAVARATRLVNDPRYRAARSARLLARVEKFDWEYLRPRFEETYARIQARWRPTTAE